MPVGQERSSQDEMTQSETLRRDRAADFRFGFAKSFLQPTITD
jgi:hypothetical protein